MEREWREASDTRRSLVGLGVVLGLAAILRFWGIGAGLPYLVGIDEPQIMTRVVRMMQTGDFNPHFFDYPSFYLYLQLAVACFRFLLGASGGLWMSLHEVSDINFYLWGRAVTAALGTGTVYLVYLIGTRWGARHALLAAALIAVLPNHVRESHFVLADVPMTFFTTLSFLLALRALEKETIGAFAWAGAAAGIAAATKYYGGTVIMVPLLAAFLATNPARSRWFLALASIGAAGGCFLLAAPYTILDLPGFLNGFASLANALRGRTGQTEPGWLIYLKHLTIGMSAGGWRQTGYFGMLLLAWGVIHSIVRGITGPGRPRFILLIAFALLYFALVSDHTLVYARYLMPLFPFVALFIAIAIVSSVTLLRRFNIPRAARAALTIGLTFVALVPPAVASISWDVAGGRPSTYSQTYAWILRNVPSHAGVIVEGGRFRLPGYYRTTNVKRLLDEDPNLPVTAKMNYAVVFSDASGPLFDAAQGNSPEHAASRRLLGRMSLVALFRNPPGGPSPDIGILKLRDDGAVAPMPALAESSRKEK